MSSRPWRDVVRSFGTWQDLLDRFQTWADVLSWGSVNTRTVSQTYSLLNDSGFEGSLQGYVSFTPIKVLVNEGSIIPNAPAVAPIAPTEESGVDYLSEFTAELPTTTDQFGGEWRYLVHEELWHHDAQGTAVKRVLNREYTIILPPGDTVTLETCRQDLEGVTAAQVHGWGTPLPASDEFNYSGPPDPSLWTVYDGVGHDGNGTRDPERVVVSNGILRIDGLANGSTGGMNHKFYQQYGRWEVRCRMFPTGSEPGGIYHGVLIVFPESNIWPEEGEYDFMENNVTDTNVKAFMHFPHVDSVPVQQRQFTGPSIDFSEWHNFGFEWTPDGLRGFLDGVQWFETSGGAIEGVRDDIQDMPSGGLTIQLDNNDGTDQQPATMEVAWARVYDVEVESS